MLEKAILAGLVARSAAKVAARRLLRGPRRPDWPWRVEFLREAVRANWDHMFRMRELPAQRAWAEASLPATELARRARRTEVDAGVPCTWLEPEDGPAEGRAILYVHGGGYVIGGLADHGDLVVRIARAARARVLFVHYRLAPEHRFPAPVDDVVRAWDWLCGPGGCRPEQVVLAGDSAGGGIVAAALLRLRDAGRPLPAAAVLLSPWVDLTAASPSLRANEPFDFGTREGLLVWARAYLGDADPREPLASPLFADLRGLPPLLVQVGGAEILLDEVRAFAQRAAEAGVDVTLQETPAMIHVWQAFAMLLPQARDAIRAIGEFVRARAVAPADVRAAG